MLYETYNALPRWKGQTPLVLLATAHEPLVF